MSNLDQQTNRVAAEVNERYRLLLKASPKIASEVEVEIVSWKIASKRQLADDYPFVKEEGVFLSMLERPCDLVKIEQSIAAYKTLCCNSKSNYNKYWDQQLARLTSIIEPDNLTEEMTRDLNSTHDLLMSEWQKLIDQLRNKWELAQIAKLREEFLKALFDKLDAMEELFRSFESLGLEPGVLFDLSSGSMSINDMEPIKRWLEYLKNDAGVQQLVDLMGRLNQVQQSEKIERVKQTVIQEVIVPDVNSKEEIVGLRLSNDLEHALPSELALMADPDTSILFDLKYIESGLMCFDLEGMQKLSTEHEIEIEQTATEDESKGPMVICVDTSGSMYGSPETIAKAITMMMVLKAKQDDRACYLINFSTTIETIDLSGGFAIENLIEFLQMSFHGGTDVAPAISHGVSVMKTDEYKNADMLIISDFVMDGLPKSLLDEISMLREEGNKFNSLVIDSCFMSDRLKSIFDNEWVYDPASSRIVELLNFQSKCVEN